MIKLISIVCLFALIIASMPAVAIDISKFDLDAIKKGYNENIENIPWVVKALAGTEKINIQVKNKDNSTTTISIETDNGKIISINKEPLEDPTLVIKVDENKIENIMTSENPVLALADTIKKKEVKIEAKSTGMSIKVMLFNFLLFVMNFVTTVGNFIKPLG